LVLGSCWCKGDFSTTIALSAPTPWVTDHRATVQYSSVPHLFVTACFVTAFGFRSIVTNRGKQAFSLGRRYIRMTGRRDRVAIRKLDMVLLTF
jgi:hypothetical protein